MNILIFLHSLSFLINFYLSYYIFARDTKSPLHRACSALLFCFAFWNITEVFMRNGSLSSETVTLFYRLSSFGWIGGLTVFLVFVLIFVGRQYLLKQKFFYPLIIIPPLFFIHLQWSRNPLMTIERNMHNDWINHWNNSIFNCIFDIYYIIMMGYTLYLCLSFYKKTTEPVKKKQAIFIFSTSLISISLVSLINIILPRVGVTSIPMFGDIFLLIWSFGLVYSMNKYKFLKMSPEAAADKIITTMPDCLILLDRTGNITTVNRQTLDLLGYSEDELIGSPVNTIFGKDNVTSSLFYRILESEEIKNEDLFFRNKNGTNIPISFSRSVLKDDIGDTIGIVCVARDMTEYKNVEKVLKKSRQFYRSLVETSPDIIFNISTSGRINALNPAFQKLTGWQVDQWIGKSLIAIIHPDDRPIFTAIAKRAMNGEPTPSYEMRIITYSGEYIHEEMIVTPEYTEEAISGLFGFAHNITGRKINEEQLRQLAYHDPLTGLPNRKSFYLHLTDLINQSRRTGITGAVLYIDIDNFKMINDSYGHDTGDSFLRDTSARLGECIRVSDKVYRIGGDEFIIILSYITREDDASIIAQNVQKVFLTPFNVSGNAFYVSASIGISIFPKDSDDPETLLKYADNAMYRAKDFGKNNYQFYNEEINIRAKEKLNLRNKLIEAIENEELIIYYQPIIKDNKILGAEAVLRWFHPEIGVIPPGQFIPLAEECGLIQKIGSWVLFSACRQNKKWHDMGFNDLYISVNISAKQLRSAGLITVIDSVLEKTGLDPEYLNLEITESCVLKDPEMTLKIMYELRKRGIKISIDNFGTGFSSLASIKKYPIDTLKIDRHFISDIINDPRDQAIVKATIDMARGMNLDTVIEGIETREQLNYLDNLECNIFQGFYFCKPLPGAEFEKILKKGIENPE